MTAPKPLTRKLGPLPVWAWALVILGAYLAYTHYSGTATAATPVTPNVGSAAQQPSGGQGTPADNSSADLLSALNANSAAADALLAAVQGGSGSGGMGVASSGGSGSPGTATAAFTAPTVADAGVTPATALPLNDAGVPMYSSYTTLGLAAPTADIGPAPQTDISSGASTASTSDALARYLANTTTASTFSAPVSSPTPTVVQPAPVDTGGVVVPYAVPGGTNKAS